MKRVLLLTPKFGGRDGVSLVSRHAAKAMAARGWQVEVASLGEDALPSGFEPARVSVVSAGNSKFRFASSLLQRALKPSSKEERPLVFVMHMHLGPAALPLVWRGARLAVFLHGTEVWKPLRRLEQAALRAASMVMANSAYTIERFKQTNPEFGNLRVTVCPLGIEPIVANASPRTLEIAERATTNDQLRSLRPFALLVSRMAVEDRYKGHDLLLEIWQKRQQGDSRLRLVIVGDGSDRVRLEEKARSLGLANSVIFTGLIPDAQLHDLYRDCEFFVLPSSDEGFGLVYLEAMRARKACIAACGAAAEVIDQGVTGLLVNPKSSEEVSGAVQDLASNPERARQMGTAGYQRFLENFTADHFADSLLVALGTES